jgi:putative flippase GtrA
VSAPGELARFGVVGVASNLVLYLLYLAATALGIGHKTAMTALYCLGVLQSFAFSRAWTFRHRGHAGGSLARYSAVYGAGYLLNLALLYALVDLAGIAHQPVQAALIALIALLTFLLQKYWVFRR